MSSNQPIVKPEVIFIDELFTDIKEGKVRIPSFHRPFVWQSTDILSLFDSVYSGYPIGSLLLWETQQDLTSSSLIGPLEIPDAPPPISYILDGQQRLSSLYGVLKLQKGFKRGVIPDDWKWWLWFDLKDGNFTYLKKGEKLPSHYFSLRAILRTVDFLAETQRINSECGNESSKYIEVAEKLAQQFKTYKIAITRIKGGDLDSAIEIFSRLHSKGKNMTPEQMAFALTYREKENNASS